MQLDLRFRHMRDPIEKKVLKPLIDLQADDNNHSNVENFSDNLLFKTNQIFKSDHE